MLGRYELTKGRLFIIVLNFFLVAMVLDVQANCVALDLNTLSIEQGVESFCQADKNNYEYCKDTVIDCTKDLTNNFWVMTYSSFDNVVAECNGYYVEDYHYRMNHLKFVCLEEEFFN